MPRVGSHGPEQFPSPLRERIQRVVELAVPDGRDFVVTESIQIACSLP
ncbi:hypothetical protein GRX01_14225 [Halobaculum sp. WSA2]|uniref:Uncharacterized protein n=1 Tax=Halobaculum saliterrae TaxID=2073113 RepID=A0A6B0T2H5_9EURY|nr:hypothetical protein [Halobaculum saliterrae]MXR42490.1 hypothetical protein [Halobaculum saliterrae]